MRHIKGLGGESDFHVFSPVLKASSNFCDPLNTTYFGNFVGLAGGLDYRILV